MENKILLFLEHSFYVSEKGEIYCEKVITNKYLERYFNVFENICICARVCDELPSNYIKEPLRKVTILPLPNYSSNEIMIHFMQCLDIIKSEIGNYKGVIIRAPSSISLLAYEVVRKVKLPFITEIVINPENLFANEKKSRMNIKSIIGKKILVHHTKKMCECANGVSYVTSNFLQKKFPCQSLMTGENDLYFDASYSSIDLEENDYSNIVFPHRNGKPFVICHIGWMVGNSKGHRMVIELANMLKADGYNIIVKFIGDGPQKNIFKEYAISLGIENEISFLGQKNSFKEIQKELNASHLFVFPSLNEGLPRVVIEAMANSLPCVSYKVDGIPELINANYLVDKGDTYGMCKLIKNFINDEDLRLRVANENYAKARNYRREILTKRRTEFYTKYKDIIMKEKR